MAIESRDIRRVDFFLEIVREIRFVHYHSGTGCKIVCKKVCIYEKHHSSVDYS